MEVASPQGWEANPELVLDFYNQRRKAALNAVPNSGHQTLALLEQHFEVSIITQNVDNLHEQAGSTSVLHLHGELFQSRSTIDSSLIYDIMGWELNLGDLCEKGSQLRPNIVWFGESVPNMEPATELCNQADVMIVVGTSLVVYPAAGLINFAGSHVPKYVVNPKMPEMEPMSNLKLIHKGAGEGLPEVRKLLLQDYGL